RSQVAAVFRKGVTNFADRAVAIVRGRFDYDGDAAGAIALEGDLLVVDAFQFAGTAQNGSLDVVLRHIFGLCRQNRSAEPSIGVGITTALCGDSDFLEQAGEDLAALRIQRALLVLDCGPFRVAGHGNLSDNKNAGAAGAPPLRV